MGEGGAALGPQRLRPVQHLRNPPLLRQRRKGNHELHEAGSCCIVDRTGGSIARDSLAKLQHEATVQESGHQASRVGSQYATTWLLNSCSSSRRNNTRFRPSVTDIVANQNVARLQRKCRDCALSPRSTASISIEVTRALVAISFIAKLKHSPLLGLRPHCRTSAPLSPSVKHQRCGDCSPCLTPTSPPVPSCPAESPPPVCRGWRGFRPAGGARLLRGRLPCSG